MIRNISAALAALLISSAALFSQTGGNDPLQGGIIAHKTATNNHDGTYTINIDAFVTGSKVTSTELVSTPVDAVLVLDYSSSMDYVVGADKYPKPGEKSRRQALETAVEQFLITMKDNQDAYNATQTDPTKKIQHRVAIVKFNVSAIRLFTFDEGNLAQSGTINTIMNSTDYVVSGSNRHQKGLTKTSIANYTRSDLGIQLGYKELTDNLRDGATPIMVFFTDGVPTGSSGGNTFTTTTADNAIKCAYNVKLDKGSTGNTISISGSNYTKGLGAPLYVVTVMNPSDSNINKFLNNVSSNYPSATNLNTPGPANSSSTDYMMVAPDEAALETAFLSIARDISSGGASFDLDETTITADIVMSDFQIAKTFGTVAKDNIDVYIRKLNSITGSTYNFSTETYPADTLEVTVTDDAIGNHVVSVTGFGFASHWCGNEYKNGVLQGLHPGGQQLCLDIKLVPNPESRGGFIATNHDDSGIYVKNKTTGEDELLHPFGTPPSVYAPCDINIERSGLKPGESAIYEVVRYKGSMLDTSFKRDVILTAGADGKATAIVKGDVVYEESGAEDLYFYEVIENPTGSRWDFNYTTTSPTGSPASIKKTLYTSGSLTNVFSFTSTKKSDDEAIGDTSHDEDSKNNKFKKLNTTNP